MRKIIAYFIKYPVAVNVTIIAFFIFGLVGVLSMKSSFFPLADSQTITINVAYPGASPQEMEEGIVLKVEDNFIYLSVSLVSVCLVRLEIQEM